jgi:hypothetical protein
MAGTREAKANQTKSQRHAMIFTQASQPNQSAQDG